MKNGHPTGWKAVFHPRSWRGREVSEPSAASAKLGQRRGRPEGSVGCPGEAR